MHCGLCAAHLRPNACCCILVCCAVSTTDLHLLLQRGSGSLICTTGRSAPLRLLLHTAPLPTAAAAATPLPLLLRCVLLLLLLLMLLMLLMLLLVLLVLLVQRVQRVPVARRCRQYWPALPTPAVQRRLFKRPAQPLLAQRRRWCRHWPAHTVRVRRIP